MQKLETYGKITSISTSEDEKGKEVKVKLEGKWELDVFHVDIQVVLKGHELDVNNLLEQVPIIGDELKVIIRDGAQTKLGDFSKEDDREETEEHVDPTEIENIEKTNLGDWSEPPGLREEEGEENEEESAEDPPKKKRGRRRKNDE